MVVVMWFVLVVMWFVLWWLRKHKDKKPTIIYYVYIMDHETISYKTLIQELSVQYTIVSHYHTKIDKFMCQFSTSRQLASSVQSLLMEIPAMNESLLHKLQIPHGHIQCVCGCMSTLTNVTTDSKIVPFTCYLNWFSTWSMWISVDTHLFRLAQNSFLAILTICYF